MTEEVFEYHEEPRTGPEPRFMAIAREYGEVVDGASLEDYVNYAVENNGYETVAIHGRQGSGKSNYSLQIGSWVVKRWWGKTFGKMPTDEELWEKVLNSIVFKPADFIKLLEGVPRNERLPIVIWDDIGVHYTSSTFKTDIEQYSAVDATWAAVRTKVGVIVVSIPVINRLAKNVKDNVTFEVFIGRNRHVQIRRLFYLPGQKNIDANLFKPIIEEPITFDQFVVPDWVWKKYWNMRLTLTEEALQALKGATDMGESSDWVPVMDAANTLGLSFSTLQQAISRDIVRGKKVGGVLCISRDGMASLASNRTVAAHTRGRPHSTAP